MRFTAVVAHARLAADLATESREREGGRGGGGDAPTQAQAAITRTMIGSLLNSYLGSDCLSGTWSGGAAMAFRSATLPLSLRDPRPSSSPRDCNGNRNVRR